MSFSFTKIISNLKFLTAKGREEQVKAAVAQALDMSFAQVDALLPVYKDAYRDLAGSLVTKTLQDPKPLLDLVGSVKAVHDHYGHDLKCVIAYFMEQVTEISSRDFGNEELRAKIEALNDR